MSDSENPRSDAIVKKYLPHYGAIMRGVEAMLPDSWPTEQRHELARTFAGLLGSYLLRAKQMRGFEDMDADFLIYRLHNALPNVCNAFGLTGRKDDTFRKGIL